jgi:hypothetical protein
MAQQVMLFVLRFWRGNNVLPTKTSGHASSDIFTEYYSMERVKRASVTQQRDSSSELL